MTSHNTMFPFFRLVLLMLKVKRKVDFSLTDHKIVSIMSHRSYSLLNAIYYLGVLIVFNGLKLNATISVGFKEENR